MGVGARCTRVSFHTLLFYWDFDASPSLESEATIHMGEGVSGHLQSTAKVPFVY